MHAELESSISTLAIQTRIRSDLPTQKKRCLLKCGRVSPRIAQSSLRPQLEIAQRDASLDQALR